MKYYKILKNNKIIIAKAKLCDTFFSRGLGLMFAKSLKEDEALIIEAEKEGILETSIHMLFVFFSIDVIWLDKHKKVVDFKRNVKPFCLFIEPKKPAKYIIELKSNFRKNIKIGDKLEFRKVFIA